MAQIIRAAATTHVLTGFLGTVTTTVYAQPLYVVNGPGGAEAFVVATEDNHVTTYNATTGAVLWDQTPTVIGPYATQNPPGGSVGFEPHRHHGHAVHRHRLPHDLLRRDDDARQQRHVPPQGLRAEPGHRQGRAHLARRPRHGDLGLRLGHPEPARRAAVRRGVLYVPYGGYDGDGGNYYGSVVGFPLAAPQTATWWHTDGAKGGDLGAGRAADRRHVHLPRHRQHLGTNGTWGGGEAVIRLARGPRVLGKRPTTTPPPTGRPSTTATPIWAAPARSSSTCRARSTRTSSPPAARTATSTSSTATTSAASAGAPQVRRLGLADQGRSRCVHDGAWEPTWRCTSRGERQQVPGERGRDLVVVKITQNPVRRRPRGARRRAASARRALRRPTARPTPSCGTRAMRSTRGTATPAR